MVGKSPGALEVFGYFDAHLGPRFEAAGLRIQFHYNQTPGIHLKARTLDVYEDAILHGLRDGMALRFPDFLTNGCVWVTEIAAHPIDSSECAFYRAGRMAIDQAFSIAESRKGGQPYERYAALPEHPV